MQSFEISMADLKQMLQDVFNKAVNSYYDLSEIVVDDTIKTFINEKSFKTDSKFFVKGNSIVENLSNISLMPFPYGQTTLVSGVSSTIENNTVELVDYQRYASYNSYSNYCFANTATVNILGTNQVGDS